jgi:hypothetical protein
MKQTFKLMIISALGLGMILFLGWAAGPKYSAIWETITGI